MKKNLTKKLVLKKHTMASLDAEKMNELHGGNANMSKNGGSCRMDGDCEGASVGCNTGGGNNPSYTCQAAICTVWSRIQFTCPCN